MASSSASPITQVEQPAQLSLADSFAQPPEPVDPAVESPNSPNPGAKPARPPKAAKRPSTANARKDNASEGTTLVGAPSVNTEAVKGDETAPAPTSSSSPSAVERDAMASTTAGEVAAGEPLVGAPVAANGATVETPKRSSTASQSASEQTGESSTSKAPTSTASPPGTATSSPSPPTLPKTSSPSSPPPAASTSKAPPPPSAAKSPSTKKRRGLFSSLFACLPCTSSTGQDDSPANTGLQKRPSTAARLLDKEKEKRPAGSTAAAKSAAKNEKSEKEKQPLPVDPETAITPPPQDALVAASPDTPAGPPPPTAAPSQRGVVLSQEETEGVTSGAVVPPGQSGHPTPPLPTKTKRRKSGKTPTGTDGIITSVPEPGARAGGILLAGGDTSEEEGSTDDEEEEEEEDEEQGLIARGGVGIPIGEDGLPHPLLDELSEDLKGRKCLVLDLDETLVHSSFKMVHQADYVVPVEIENQFHNVYVIKRPGVDGFLKAMGEIYEVVVFTASLSKYADPVLDQLDVHRVVKHRLFRESCYNNKGNYVKDLSQLGRPMEECIIIDNSPASYVFHPNNAVPISSWFNDPHDTELTDLVPFLTDLGMVDDVRAVLDANLYQQIGPVPGGGGTGLGVEGTGFVQV
ncbi:hypothetical protein JCM8547_005907 [Rhodosporidiobolus lusitaniae]